MADSPATPQDPDKGYVVLRDSENKPVWYKPEDVAKGLAAGFRREAPEETKDRHLREWASDNPTLAGAAAAARTLSFGATGFIKPKEQQALAEENPTATTALEFGSLALPLAGEWGVASKAARILSESRAVRNAGTVIDTVAKATGAPMAAAGKVGQAVGGAVGKVAGNALGNAARFATEAELYNIGANVGEAALGDEELTANRLLAHSGSALALGAGLGLGGHAATSAATRLLEKSNGALEKVADIVRNKIPQLSKMEDAAVVAKEAYVDASSALSNKPRKLVDELVSGVGTPEGMARREKLLDLSGEEQEAIAKDLGDNLKQSVDTLFEAVHKKGYTEAVPALVKKELSARPAMGPVFDDAVEVFKAARQAEARMAASPKTYDPNVTEQLKALRDSFEYDVFGAKTAEQAFEKMLAFRRALSDRISYGTEASLGDAALKAQAEVRGLRARVNEHLRNEAAYGGAAAGYAKIDAAYTKLKELTDPGTLFGSQFLKRFKQTGGGKRIEINYPGLQTWLRQIDTTRGNLRLMGFDEFYAGLKEVNEALSGVSSLADTAYDRAIIDRLTGHAEKSAKYAAERLRENALLRAKTNDTTSLDNLARKGISSAGGAVVGAVLGGPVGAVVGAGLQHGYNMVRDPVLAGRTILAMERLSSKVSDETKKSIMGFLGTTARAAKTAAVATGKAAVRAGRATAQAVERTAAPASVFAMRDMLEGFDKKDLPKVQGGDKSDSARMKDFRQLEALLIDLTTNPERAYDRYADAFKAFRQAAPNVTDRLIQKQLEAAQYLFSKMPKNPSYGKTLNDAINDWKPSDQDLAKFERYVKAAQDPLSVLEDMKQGRITREGVETLQTLYPALYKSIQDVTMENLATLQKRLPYTQRINLSLLLNAPVDPSVSPAFVATMQGFYQGSVQSQVQGQQGGRTKGTGGSAIHPGQLKSIGKSMLTPAQAVSYKSSLLK